MIRARDVWPPNFCKLCITWIVTSFVSLMIEVYYFTLIYLVLVLDACIYDKSNERLVQSLNIERCLNAGRCVNGTVNEGYYSCDCPPGYTGARCEIGTTVRNAYRSFLLTANRYSTLNRIPKYCKFYLIRLGEYPYRFSWGFVPLNQLYQLKRVVWPKAIPQGLYEKSSRWASDHRPSADWMELSSQ